MLNKIHILFLSIFLYTCGEDSFHGIDIPSNSDQQMYKWECYPYMYSEAMPEAFIKISSMEIIAPNRLDANRQVLEYFYNTSTANDVEKLMDEAIVFTYNGYNTILFTNTCTNYELENRDMERIYCLQNENDRFFTILYGDESIDACSKVEFIEFKVNPYMATTQFYATTQYFPNIKCTPTSTGLYCHGIDIRWTPTEKKEPETVDIPISTTTANAIVPPSKEISEAPQPSIQPPIPSSIKTQNKNLSFLPYLIISIILIVVLYKICKFFNHDV